MPTIICGFPGVGKSSITGVNSTIPMHDSDSSRFSWISKGVRHPEWPANYIAHIKTLTGFVFVSTHKEVRDALRAADIPFAIVRPAEGLCAEYIARYRQRGSPEAFCELLNKQWDAWMHELIKEPVPTYVLSHSQFLGDIPFRWFAHLAGIPDRDISGYKRPITPRGVQFKAGRSVLVVDREILTSTTRYPDVFHLRIPGMEGINVRADARIIREKNGTFTTIMYDGIPVTAEADGLDALIRELGFKLGPIEMPVDRPSYQHAREVEVTHPGELGDMRDANVRAIADAEGKPASWPPKRVQFFKPEDIIEVPNHCGGTNLYVIKGVFVGGLGQDSLVTMSPVAQRPGSDGPTPLEVAVPMRMLEAGVSSGAFTHTIA